MRVHYGIKSRKSGRVLQQALAEVRGQSINWGYERGGEINPSIRNASNKRLALGLLGENGVPTPRLYDRREVLEAPLPLVGRPDRHRAGKDFYLCHDRAEVMSAINRGCTHFLEYIDGGREFRVHIAFGKSIKIAEKLGGNRIVRNFENGCYFGYPQNFNHKITLRNVCKQAVKALGLDFGAVDVIYKDRKFYVLEVNSAPSLTSNSDILERYVKAFTDNERGYEIM